MLTRLLRIMKEMLVMRVSPQTPFYKKLEENFVIFLQT